jgi:hypothetical protein
MLSRPSNVLKAIENKAVDIRKLLADVKKPLDQRAWKERGDAMRLAATIEAVASRGADLHAADRKLSSRMRQFLFRIKL